MKRNVKNDKVLRAIAIGLATMIAATSVPATTFAAPSDGTPSTPSDGAPSAPSNGADAEQDITDSIMIVDRTNVNLSSQNVTSARDEALAADAADAAADKAIDTARKAEIDAVAAATAASDAQTAADNAADIADAAEGLYNALVSGTEGQETELAKEINTAADIDPNSTGDNAVKAWTAADNAINNTANGAKALIGEANQAVTNAETAISGENGVNAAITAVNNQVETAENAIQTANASKGTKSDKTTTEGLIDTAKTTVEEKKQAESDAETEKAKIEGEMKTVQGEVDEATGKYTTADSDAEKAIKDISAAINEAMKVDSESDPKTLSEATKTLAGEANKAMTNASDESQKAATALGDTQDNFDKVQELVNSDSHDVVAAAQYAKDARDAANRAQDAANNAKDFAEEAKKAEKAASDKCNAAQKKLEAAQKALEDAMNNYETDYGKADEAADNADGKVLSVNNKIDTLNGNINDLKNYDNQEVTDANAAIDVTNGLIDDAQDEIDKLTDTDGLEATVVTKKDVVENSETGLKTVAAGKIAYANAAIDTANDLIDTLYGAGENKGALAKQLAAIEKAKEDLATAKDGYDQAVQDKLDTEKKYKSAAAWAEKAEADAATANTKADAAQKDVDDKRALIAAAETTSKDALAQIKFGENVTYETLTSDVKKAEEDVTKAEEDIEIERAKIPGLQQNVTKVTEEANAQIKIYQDEINRQNDLLNGVNGEQGLLAQQSAKASEIAGYQNTINQYDYEEEASIFNWFPEPSKIKKARTDLSEAEAVLQAGLGHYEEYTNIWGKKKQRWVGNTQQDLDNANNKKNAANEIISDYNNVKALLNTATGEKTTIDNNVTAAQNAIKEQNALIDTENGKIKTAEDAVTTQNGVISGLEDDLEIKKGTVKACQERVAQIDGFEYTDDNTLVLSAEDLQTLENSQAYKDLVKQLNDDYGENDPDFSYTDFSYTARNSDTTVFGNSKGGLPHIVTTIIPGTKGYTEGVIESKYNVGVWNALFNDNATYNMLKSDTNAQCVIVCADVDKISILRSTFASAKFEKAQTEASTAKTNAATALTNLNNAKQTEEDALKVYNDALEKLEDAEEELANYDQEKGTKKLTKYGDNAKIQDPTYTGYIAQKSVTTTLVDKYDTETEITPETDYVGAYEYGKNGGTGTIDTKLSNTTRGLKKAFSVKASAEDSKDVMIEDGKEEVTEKSLYEQLLDLISEAEKELEAAQDALTNATRDREAADEKYTAAKNDAEKADKIAKDAEDLAKKVVPEQKKKDTGDNTNVIPVSSTVDNTNVTPASITGDTSASTTEGFDFSNLFNNNAGSDEGSGDEGYSSFSSSEGTTAALVSTGTTAGTTTGTPAMTLTPVASTGNAAGTGGRTVAANRGGAAGQGVLGARVEANNDNADDADNTDNTAATTQKKTDVAPTVDKSNIVTADDTDAADKQAGTAIANPETPLSATPFEDGIGMSWAWLLAVAAAGGAGVYGYERHKKKVAANDEMKKYKKN